MVKVAVKAKNTPSTEQNWSADTCKTGGWKKLGPPLMKTSMKLFAENKPVLLSAKGIFAYIGGAVKAGPACIPLPPLLEIVTLDPESSQDGDAEQKLTTDSASKKVLRDGELKTSPKKNIVEVSESSDKLHTA